MQNKLTTKLEEKELNNTHGEYQKNERHNTHSRTYYSSYTHVTSTVINK